MSTNLSLARINQTIRRFTNPVIRRARYNKIFSKQKDSAALRRQFKQLPTVFVYQMGKVASTSIYESLKTSDYSGAVLHAHSFDQYHDSSDVRCFFEYYKNHRPKTKLVSLVREPVSRNISAFFQNFRRDTGLNIEECDLDFRELKQRFLKNYPHEIPLIWFDNQIKRHFGIDVYQYPFPDAGYLQVQNGNVELLVMRHDLHDQIKERLIGDFVGIDDFKISRENIASEKRYAKYYEEFRRLKLPLDHLYYLASSKYMHHFFERDIGDMLNNWTDRPLPNRS